MLFAYRISAMLKHSQTVTAYLQRVHMIFPHMVLLIALSNWTSYQSITMQITLLSLSVQLYESTGLHEINISVSYLIKSANQDYLLAASQDKHNMILKIHNMSQAHILLHYTPIIYFIILLSD